VNSERRHPERAEHSKRRNLQIRTNKRYPESMFDNDMLTVSENSLLKPESKKKRNLIFAEAVKQAQLDETVNSELVSSRMASSRLGE
jgi:hypothetical protein